MSLYFDDHHSLCSAVVPSLFTIPIEVTEEGTTISSTCLFHFTCYFGFLLDDIKNFFLTETIYYLLSSFEKEKSNTIIEKP